MTKYRHPFLVAPSDQPLVYYRPGWVSRLPAIIRDLNGQRILFTDKGVKLAAVANLPVDSTLEEVSNG